MQNDEYKIYVGNIAYEANAKDLIEFFSQYGHVHEVMLITNKHTGKSKGFAFVSFESEEASKKALENNGVKFMGRNLAIQPSKERTAA